MRTGRQLLLAGGISFLLFLVAALPARVPLGLLAGRGITASGVEGTLWRGEARRLDAGKIHLQKLRWQLAPFALFLGRLEASVQADLPDGFLDTRIAWSRSGLTLRNLKAASALAPLAPTLAGVAGNSQVALDLEQLRLRDGWVADAVGTARLAEVALPIPGLNGPGRGAGTYEVSFAARDLAPGAPLVGQVRDAGGLLEVAGELKVTPPANYEIAGTVGTRPGAPPDLVNAVKAAGPRTADGHNQFSVAGTF